MARILIAEDEEPLRKLIARALGEEGHLVVTTADGTEALDMLQSEDGGFDLLLADIKMPGMDGIALTLAVARDYPKLPILLMTGYADQRERVAGLERADLRRHRQAVLRGRNQVRGRLGAGQGPALRTAGMTDPARKRVKTTAMPYRELWAGCGSASLAQGDGCQS